MSQTSSTSQAGKPQLVERATAVIRPAPDLVSYLKQYAEDHPKEAALWCLGLGFVLGWKLKPW